ncbi:MAG: hypothetical protein R3C19_09475 [Planctomycetaceae bacterium]
MKTRIIVAFSLTLAVLCNMPVGVPCPFCDAPSLTMAEQIDQSGHLLLAKWLGGEKPTNESAGTAKFEVIKVGKSRDDAFKTGDVIELPQYLAGANEKLYALMGPGTDFVDWHSPCEVTPSSWEYLANMPAPVAAPEMQSDRLAYFLAYLEHPELLVSNDAYAEFASAPYDVIKPLSPRMPREKLREWVTSPDTAVTRLGLYGLLLGLCGNDGDATAMEHKILLPDSDFRLGIEGVMSGYLIIRGEDGLKVLEDSKMKATTFTNKDGEDAKLPFSETYAAMQTLRFMWTYEPDRVPKERLKESMRNLLERPELADLVIADLARWKDWGVQERLMAMYSDEEFDIPSIKRAIVRYLFYCSEDVEKGAETKPEYAVTAATYLAELEALDPKIVRDAKRFLIR